MSQGNSRLPVDVLLSGGVDSATCVAYYIEAEFEVNGIFVNYGQPAAIPEARAAQAIANHFGISLTRLDVVGAKKKSGGLIPGRNAFLLFCALLELQTPTHLIGIGIHSGTSYADCSGLFVESMQRVFDLYAAGRVRVEAPFLNWAKANVWDYAESQGVPLSLTYSCEFGSEPPCGKCLSCRDVEALHARA